MDGLQLSYSRHGPCCRQRQWQTSFKRPELVIPWRTMLQAHRRRCARVAVAEARRAGPRHHRRGAAGGDAEPDRRLARAPRAAARGGRRRASDSSWSPSWAGSWLAHLGVALERGQFRGGTHPPVRAGHRSSDLPAWVRNAVGCERAPVDMQSQIAPLRPASSDSPRLSAIVVALLGFVLTLYLLIEGRRDPRLADGVRARGAPRQGRADARRVRAGHLRLRRRQRHHVDLRRAGRWRRPVGCSRCRRRCCWR